MFFLALVSAAAIGLEPTGVLPPCADGEPQRWAGAALAVAPEHAACHDGVVDPASVVRLDSWGLGDPVPDGDVALAVAEDTPVAVVAKALSALTGDRTVRLLFGRGPEPLTCADGDAGQALLALEVPDGWPSRQSRWPARGERSTSTTWRAPDGVTRLTIVAEPLDLDPATWAERHLDGSIVVREQGPIADGAYAIRWARQEQVNGAWTEVLEVFPHQQSLHCTLETDGVGASLYFEAIERACAGVTSSDDSP